MSVLPPEPTCVLLGLADHPEYHLEDLGEPKALEREQEAMIAWLTMPGAWLPPYARLPPYRA